jgi:hypothetical protein
MIFYATKFITVLGLFGIDYDYDGLYMFCVNAVLIFHSYLPSILTSRPLLSTITHWYVSAIISLACILTYFHCQINLFSSQCSVNLHDPDDVVKTRLTLNLHHQVDLCHHQNRQLPLISCCLQKFHRLGDHVIVETCFFLGLRFYLQFQAKSIPRMLPHPEAVCPVREA